MSYANIDTLNGALFCLRRCEMVYFNENNLKGTVYQADKFLQVNMTLLMVLIIVHEYIEPIIVAATLES